MINLAKASKEASKKLMAITSETRVKILNSIASTLKENTDLIIKENQKDLKNAKESNLPASLLDRLTLDEQRINDMISGVLEISAQKEVVGSFSSEVINSVGLKIKKQQVPLGVILMIFESRPNVVVDCAALAIKSSNAIILKGGKEALHSNTILGKLIQESISKYIPAESVQTLASDNREVIDELLQLKDQVDVVIPRGGERLIEHVYKTSRIPVIAHFKGLCHVYIDEYADNSKALDIIVNAKTQRTGVCNATETLLVHINKLTELAPLIVQRLSEKNTELRVDSEFKRSLPNTSTLIDVKETDWDEEYLDNILSVKTVNSIEDAISHIDKHGSHHTECIISEKEEKIEMFLNSVDASCITINASTRFNDGGELGLGAELGISTTKFHAYGPMGAEQMTTTRYVVVGNGHIRK